MGTVSIESNTELERMGIVGIIAAPALHVMAGSLRARVTTGELSGIGARRLRHSGATSDAPLAFPADDGSLSAHDEHRVVINRGRPALLTAA